MNCISDTEKFARRMFRICLVLAAGMALITLYWWILWDLDLAVAGRFDRGGTLRQECHRHSGAALAAAGYFTRKAGQQSQCLQLPVGHPCTGILDPVLAENYPGPGEKRASGFRPLLQPGRFLHDCASVRI